MASDEDPDPNPEAAVKADEGPALEVETRVRARPETVFAFFTDPDKYRHWMGIDAELDPRPGGVYRVNVTGQNVVRGEYLEIDPPRRIVFTWGFEHDTHLPPGSTTVEVTLHEDGDATIVRVRHSGLPTDQSRAEHEQGWQHYLQRLSVAGSGGDPGPDPLAGA